jgi:molybdenum cofactor guanylyltransferase
MQKYMYNKKQTTGIILCGGKSSRIGMNKALLMLGKMSLLEHAAASIKPLSNQLIVSGNSKDFPNSPFEFIPDIIPGIGPISGIYSALIHSSTEHNLIISCDNPFLSSHLLHYMLENSQGFDIVLPEFDNIIQSLTGYFNKSSLSFIAEEIQKKHYKPIEIFKHLNIKILKIDQTLPFYKENLFLNINTYEDYTEACRIHQNFS